MQASELVRLLNRPQLSIYEAIERTKNSSVRKIIVSTPESRSITNDPLLAGIAYTKALEQACTKVLIGLKALKLFPFHENECTVLHVLRGGLNFGLRGALAEAFQWNDHASAFISAQRSRKAPDSPDWVITESEYKKIHLRARNTIVFGDVVATGTSLEFALSRIHEASKEHGAQITGLLFFTIGGPRSHEILESVCEKLRGIGHPVEHAIVVYFEGIFTVAEAEHGLSTYISGTDLIRTRSILAPEFLQSQLEHPAYPIERCTIYDAGSRAFDIHDYLMDVKDYWEKVHGLALQGISYEALVQERFPEFFNTEMFASLQRTQTSLEVVCKERLKQIQSKGLYPTHNRS